MKINSALSIAGSDPSSGAGIQALTVQNTKEITEIFPIPSEIVIKQIKSILADIKIESIKIGMVYDESIITKLYDILKNENIYSMINILY